MSKKLVNLSESTLKNSRKTVPCPKCKGEISICDVCFGSGEVSKNKINRLKESDAKISDKT